MRTYAQDARPWWKLNSTSTNAHTQRPWKGEWNTGQQLFAPSRNVEPPQNSSLNGIGTSTPIYKCQNLQYIRNCQTTCNSDRMGQQHLCMTTRHQMGPLPQRGDNDGMEVTTTKLWKTIPPHDLKINQHLSHRGGHNHDSVQYTVLEGPQHSGLWWDKCRSAQNHQK